MLPTKAKQDMLVREYPRESYVMAASVAEHLKMCNNMAKVFSAVEALS